MAKERKVRLPNPFEALLILMTVGLLISSFMMSGTIPALIYYGLNLLTPKLFLPIGCILTAIVGLACGSSWTATATIGIAMLGIGAGLGISPAMTAGMIISGGNFHGEPMALPFDFLGIAASELTDSSERRIERMVNAALSNGLTPFLTTQAGVNSGFMIVQYAAASMVSENKVYAHPASVDSIPSSANQEDIVSMGTTAARKARMILQNAQDVLADELMVACQAIDIRRRVATHGEGITPLHQAILDHVREKVAFYEIDREIWPDIRACEEMVRSGELLDIVEKFVPDFE